MGIRLLGVPFNSSGMADMVARTRAAVAEAHQAGEFPLLLGGDCPVLLGALAEVEARGPRSLAAKVAAELARAAPAWWLHTDLDPDGSQAARVVDHLAAMRPYLPAGPPP